mmetsp:Transcript_72153/g.145146  ORF Transcript_72153/g.145146 Transcript_72153/m.145146 type:complete len:82 (-) Transcript_72153:53-298(-)
MMLHPTIERGGCCKTRNKEGKWQESALSATGEKKMAPFYLYCANLRLRNVGCLGKFHSGMTERQKMAAITKQEPTKFVLTG